MREFIESFNVMQREVHEIAKSKGWWDDIPEHGASIGDIDGSKIALMHSELSETLEALRDFKGFGLVEEELTDVVIRIMDYAQFRHLNVGEAIIDKIEINKKREHKHGGKKF